MLLDILECTGHPSPTKNHQIQTISSPEVEKVCSKKKRADMLKIKRLIHRILKKHIISDHLVVRTPASGKMRKKKFNF